MYKQEAPFTIQVYLAEGCNIKVPRPDGTNGLCWACGLNAIRSGPGDYKFLTVETADRIASEIARVGWNSQLLFAGHGEPSMNPNMVKIIATFRKHLPRAYLVMLSNAGGFIKEGRIAEIFNAGLNTLALEDYKGAHLLERVDLTNIPGNVTLGRYPENKEFNPHKRERHKRLVIVSDIEKETKGNHSVLNNHAGSGLPPNKNYHGKRCAKPFRELAISWDGFVAGCCILWRREIEAGNIITQGIDEIWNNNVFQAMRRILIKGQRQLIEPCSKCDHPSYRVGLLPDKYGKVTLPDYTVDDVELLKQSKTKTPVNVVLREWEK